MFRLNTLALRVVNIANMSSNRSLFVQNARLLEKLKTSPEDIPSHFFQCGKYLFIGQDGNSILVDNSSMKIAWKTQKDLLELKDAGIPLTILLDVVSVETDVCLFAAHLPNSDQNLAQQWNDCKFVHGRKALFTLDDQESSLVSHARGLINFNLKVKFCKHCGQELEATSSGTQKTCTGCKTTHYPPLAPVAIVLIEDKSHSKTLLVRSARHPEGMYSCVAGFIEPGESLENSIRREVAEEVGLDIDNLEYVASQHWAMPESQLMLGLIATATSLDHLIDPVEIQSAQWQDPETIREALARAKQPTSGPLDRQRLWVPPPSAIAHTLMEKWLDKYHKKVNVTNKL